MKRGSLRCELDSATPSGLQQAALGGTGGERAWPCRQSPVHCPGSRTGSTPGRRRPSGTPRTAPAARRTCHVPIGYAARAARAHWLRHAPSACWRAFGSSPPRAAETRPRPAPRPDQWPHDRRSAPPPIAHWPSHPLVIVAVPPLEQRESPPGIHWAQDGGAGRPPEPRRGCCRRH